MLFCLVFICEIVNSVRVGSTLQIGNKWVKSWQQLIATYKLLYSFKVVSKQ